MLCCKFAPPPPTSRVAKLTSRRVLFAPLGIGLPATTVVGFFMSGEVAPAHTLARA